MEREIRAIVRTRHLLAVAVLLVGAVCLGSQSAVAQELPPAEKLAVADELERNGDLEMAGQLYAEVLADPTATDEQRQAAIDGVWVANRKPIRITLEAADVLVADGDLDSAKTLYQEILKDPDATNDQRESAQAGLDAIEASDGWVGETVEWLEARGWGIDELVGAVVVLLVAFLLVAPWLRSKAWWPWAFVVSLRRTESDSWVWQRLNRWLGSPFTPRVGWVKLDIVGDDSVAVGEQIRSQLASMGLAGPTPSTGGMGESAIDAVAELAPSGNALIKLIKTARLELRPGGMHRVGGTLQDKGEGTPDRFGIALQVRGRVGANEIHRTVWGASVADVGQEAAWIVYEHALLHGRAQRVTLPSRRWNKPGSYVNFRKGQRFVELAKPKEAVAHLANAAQAEPTNVQVHLWLAHAHNSAKRYDDALLTLLGIWNGQTKPDQVFLQEGDSCDRTVRQDALAWVATTVNLAYSFAYVDEWSGTWPELFASFDQGVADKLNALDPSFQVPAKTSTSSSLRGTFLSLSGVLLRAVNPSCDDHIGDIQRLAHEVGTVPEPEKDDVRRGFWDLEAKLTGANPVSAGEHYERALFYSRALELGAVPPVDSNHPAEFAAYAATSAVAELDAAMMDPGWRSEWSLWLRADPDLEHLRARDEFASWDGNPNHLTPITPPAYLDPDARGRFEQLVTQLREAGKLDVARLDLIAALATSLHRLHQIEGVLNDTGMDNITELNKIAPTMESAARYREQVIHLSATLDIAP